MTKRTEDDLVSVIERLIQRVNDLEIQLADLQDRFVLHSHPWKPEPRYGGRL